MARTGLKYLLAALVGLSLLPDRNEARVLSETRFGYGDADSVSAISSVPSSASDQESRTLPVSPPIEKEIVSPLSLPVNNPVLRSETDSGRALYLLIDDKAGVSQGSNDNRSHPVASTESYPLDDEKELKIDSLLPP